MRHSAGVTGARRTGPARVLPAVGVSPGARGYEARITALALAILVFLGGVLGSLNLAVGGVVRPGAPHWFYLATMSLCMLASVPLLLRQRVGRWATFGLVLLGDLVYVVVALCLYDPVHYATPLMLLFPAFVAASFLGPWELGINMVVTVGACLAARWHAYPNGVELAIQTVVNASMLNASAFGVFLLRRRIQRLLDATQALSSTDPLTGLWNRRYLVQQAPRMWRQARRDGTRVAAMVLDLDHFKRLNDAHGHATGDAVLQAVAVALGATVRPADVLARIGGEELVVLGMVADGAEAHHLAERLRTAVRESRTADGHRVTASIGIALTRPVDGEDATDALWRLVDRADAAMYEAKQQGRDRVATVTVPRPRPELLEAPPAGQPRGNRPGSPASDVA
jgi:diguanylate cyclase (GGDEF)-like protein